MNSQGTRACAPCATYTLNAAAEAAPACLACRATQSLLAMGTMAHSPPAPCVHRPAHHHPSILSHPRNTPSSPHATPPRPHAHPNPPADKLVPVSNSLRLARMLPGARVAVLKRSGHCPQEEVPEGFAQIMGAFLGSLAA